MKEVLLCVGGLDPSAGAGILADLRAAHAAGGEAVTVLSALTAQNSGSIVAVKAVPPGWVRRQIEALEQEISFGAVKTGLFADRATIAEFAEWYGGSGAGPLVVDPVLVGGDGTRVASRSVQVAMVRLLLPLAALITPNRLEAELLSGEPIRSPGAMESAARKIAELGPAAVLVKGGHVPGPPVDLLWDGDGARLLRGGKRLPGRWHGLGCHLASAIGARLALGDPLARAVSIAHGCLVEGMRRARKTASGRFVPCWPAA